MPVSENIETKLSSGGQFAAPDIVEKSPQDLSFGPPLVETAVSGSLAEDQPRRITIRQDV
jgi:hypothetical protein